MYDHIDQTNNIKRAHKKVKGIEQNNNTATMFAYF